jgi:hypothetical protein
MYIGMYDGTNCIANTGIKIKKIAVNYVGVPWRDLIALRIVINIISRFLISINITIGIFSATSKMYFCVSRVHFPLGKYVKIDVKNMLLFPRDKFL